VPSEPAVLPRDEQERAFWRAELSAAYQIGRKQADDIFELNVARLQRTYLGMRRFYDLFARGMVTAPTIVASSSVIDREDPNTIVVGGTVFRITAGTTFVEETQQWVPLGR
jgi:defect-in-organelle-trafficking protein DotC